MVIAENAPRHGHRFAAQLCRAAFVSDASLWSDARAADTCRASKNPFLCVVTASSSSLA